MKPAHFIFRTIVIAFLLPPCFASAQQMNDENTFVDANGREFKVGDDFVIGYPSGSSGEFKFIISTAAKKLGWVNNVADKVSDAGKSISKAGAELGSSGTYTTGRDASGKASSASDVSEAGTRLLTGNHDLTGQNLRVLRFSVKGNKKRGERFFAIVAGPGNGNYEIELIPAMNMGELAGVNNELFEDYKPASN